MPVHAQVPICFDLMVIIYTWKVTHNIIYDSCTSISIRVTRRQCISR